MSNPEPPPKSHLYQPSWNHRETKVIRVPVAFADVLLSVARQLDTGIPLAAINEVIGQTDLAVTWDDYDAQIQAVLQELPAPRRLPVRQALLQLLARLSQPQEAATTVTPTTAATTETAIATTATTAATTTTKPPQPWLLPQQRLLAYIQAKGAMLAPPTATWEPAWVAFETVCRLAGTALLLLDLLCPSASTGGRALDGANDYAMAEWGQALWLLSVAGPPQQHHTVFRVYETEHQGQRHYAIDASQLTLRDVERFAVCHHYLERALTTSATPAQQVQAAKEILQLL